MKKCNATCEHACGCLCDRTPGAAVPVQWPPHDGRVSQIQCDAPPDWVLRQMMGQRAMSAEAMRARDMHNAFGMQNAYSHSLDVWHEAQEQEAEDAAWRDRLFRRGLRDVRIAALVALLVTAAVIYSRMS